MKNIQEFTGRLTDISRLKSSINGNPRFQGRITRACICNGTWFDIIFKTAPDSGLGYSFENFNNKVVKVTIGDHYNQNTLNSIELDTTPEKKNYCQSELENLGKYQQDFKIKVSGSQDSTRWMDLNLECIEALENFLNTVKKGIK